MGQKVLMLFSCFLFWAGALLASELKFTTYYPSPFGEYEELRAKRMAIGTTYNNPVNYKWGDNVPATAGLIVEQNVGIGLFNPNYPLDVSGEAHISGNIMGDADLVIEQNGHIKQNLWVEGKTGVGTLAPQYKLDVNGMARITDDILGNKNLIVDKDGEIKGALSVNKQTWLKDDLVVDKNATVKGNAVIKGSEVVEGSSKVKGQLRAEGGLYIKL